MVFQFSSGNYACLPPSTGPMEIFILQSFNGALPLFRILGLPKFRKHGAPKMPIFLYQSKTSLTGSRQGKIVI